MKDLLLAGGWLTVLVLGLGFCVEARRRGLPGTYVRDLLHVGAGVWVLGWPFWGGVGAPAGIVLPVAALVSLAPWMGAVPGVTRITAAITDPQEKWTGIVLYVVSYAALTLVGILDQPFPAAAGLLALSLGDGLGGFVGRLAGRIHYRLPWAKPRSLEGSAVVAVMSAAGVVVAGLIFGVEKPVATIVAAGLVAALAEGLSPRSTDNLFVPLAVWLFLRAGWV